jgi:hypothetical protein
MSQERMTLRSSGERLVVLLRELLSRLTPRPSRVVVVAVIVSLVFSAAAMAAAGDLDPTFSGDGKQISNFGAGPSAAEAVVLEAAGLRD